MADTTRTVTTAAAKAVPTDKPAITTGTATTILTKASDPATVADTTTPSGAGTKTTKEPETTATRRARRGGGDDMGKELDPVAFAFPSPFLFATETGSGGTAVKVRAPRVMKL